MADLERKYVDGTISTREVAEWDAATYRGRTKREILAMLDSAPEIGGIADAVARLKAAGVHVLIGTITWAFAAEHFHRKYGFDAYSGVEMGETADGVLTGEVTKFFDEHDKIGFVEAFCRARGIGMDEVAAVGDSRSDIPLFGRVGRAIALNATPAARAAAHQAIDADHLDPVLRSLLQHR